MSGAPAPAERQKRVTETSDYVAMMKRIIIGYGQRIGEDPVALVHLAELTAAMRDAVNRGMYLANQPGANGQRGYSMNDMAKILDVSRQAVQKRVHLGESAHLALQVLKGNGAVVRIADVRAERAAGLQAAELDDRTGSVRELAAFRQAATG
jgi:hypothetical protein